MGWLIALGILTLIAIIPIGVSAIYNAEGPRAYVIAGPFHICVFPGKKQDKKETSKSTVKPKTSQKATGKKQSSKPAKGGSLLDFLPLLDRVLDFLTAFKGKLRVPNLEMKLVLAGGDPSDLAVNYGRGWALLGNLMPLLDGAFVIKKRDLEVECDFLEEQTTIKFKIDISITVGRTISLLIIHGVPILREFMKIMNNRKGGAKA